MSKTHWLAVAQVILGGAQQLGFVPLEAAGLLQNVLVLAFSGSLFHRGFKIATGGQS